MIVKVSTRTKKETDLEKAIRTIKTYYQRALDTNKIHPGFIQKPIAWALYQTWRDIDAKGNKGNG